MVLLALRKMELLTVEVQIMKPFNVHFLPLVCCRMLALILQLAGPSGTLTQSDFLNNKYSEQTTPSNSFNNSSYSPPNRIQPGGRYPSQTAPARLGMWDDDDDEKILKVSPPVHVSTQT